MSNYLAGVTGNEPQIAGWAHDTDFRDDREVSCQNDECDLFEKYEEKEVSVEQWGDRNTTYERWGWKCPKCGDESEREREFSNEDDREYEPDYFD
jgi:hypothetical protein